MRRAVVLPLLLAAPPEVLVPVKRRAEELLAEWRAPAVRLDPDYGLVRLATREKLPKGVKPRAR